MPHYTGEQKKIALEMLGECESVAEAARRFGYPSRGVFHHRAKNNEIASRKLVQARFPGRSFNLRETAIALNPGQRRIGEDATRSKQIGIYPWKITSL